MVPTDIRYDGAMSELGQKRKCPGSRGTSVLPSAADIVSLPRHVRLVPIVFAKIQNAVRLIFP